MSLTRRIGLLVVSGCALGLAAGLAPTTGRAGSAAEQVEAATAATTAATTTAREPRVADRDAMRVRVVNRPTHGQGVVRRAPPLDPALETVAPQSSNVPESYRAKGTGQDYSVDGMTFTERPILTKDESGRDFLDRATEADSGPTPENYAAQILPRDQRIDVTRASRYREDFVVPVDLSASEFCYRPLYFQEVNLERYGASYGPWQPLVSGARFFATVPALPYLMTVHKPCVCRYWTHQFPAGRYAPCWEKEGPPFDPEAAGIEGLAVYGLILLIP